MFNNLQGLGLGIITFAIIIGVGAVILLNFTGAVATCPAGYNTGLGGWNTTLAACMNDTGSITNTSTDYGAASTNVAYLNTQLGTSGLAGWTPAIIAITVGMLFLGIFLTRGKKRI